MTPISDIIDEPMPFHLARSRWGMEQSQMIGRIEWHIKQREQRLAQLPLIHYFNERAFLEYLCHLKIIVK